DERGLRRGLAGRRRGAAGRARLADRTRSARPMRVFVAGATGAIGRPLVECLLAPGHEATGMTRSPERAEALRRRSLTCALCARFVPGHHLEGRRRGADAPSTVTHLA